MKRYVKSNSSQVSMLVDESITSSTVTASEYDEYWTTTVDKQRYSLHYTGSITEEMPSLDAFRAFKAQVRKIAPYDDAEYFWARIANGTVEYIQNGKVKDTSSYGTSDDADLDNTDWISCLIEDVCLELNDLNKNIEPIMVHN